MTKTMHKYDSSWGTMRTWAIGLTFDGERFEEPLDRKNKRTGELEDLIQMKTDLFVITARNTGDPNDDDESNFQYLMGPHSSNRMKDAMDRLKERDRIIQDLQKKLDESENQRDYYQREADASGSEIRMLKNKVSLLSEKVANVEEQASHYRTELKKAHIGGLESEGAIDENLRGARNRGAFSAKDSSDVVIDAAKKQREAKKHLANIGVGEISPEYATKEDLDKLEQKIANLLTTFASTKTSKTESSTPSPPRIPRPPEED